MTLTIDQMEDLVGRLEAIAGRVEEIIKPSEWVSVSKAAEIVGVSKRTLMHWIKKYGIPHSKVPSGTILIKLSSLIDWLQSHGTVKKEVNLKNENLSEREKEFVEDLLKDLV